MTEFQRAIRDFLKKFILEEDELKQMEQTLSEKRDNMNSLYLRLQQTHTDACISARDIALALKHANSLFGLDLNSEYLNRLIEGVDKLKKEIVDLRQPISAHKHATLIINNIEL